jgi:hypothetical protein
VPAGSLHRLSALGLLVSAPLIGVDDDDSQARIARQDFLGTGPRRIGLPFLGIVVIPEDAAADASNERPVSLDDRLEGRGIPPLHEPIQQWPVREQSDGALVEERAQLLNRRMLATALHVAAP